MTSQRKIAIFTYPCCHLPHAQFLDEVQEDEATKVIFVVDEVHPHYAELYKETVKLEDEKLGYTDRSQELAEEIAAEAGWKATGEKGVTHFLSEILGGNITQQAVIDNLVAESSELRIEPMPKPNGEYSPTELAQARLMHYQAEATRIHLEMELAQYNADSPRKELWERIKVMEAQLTALTGTVVALSKEAHDS